MEDIVSDFYTSDCKFYCVLVDSLRKKFPFKSSLLTDLMVLSLSAGSHQDDHIYHYYCFDLNVLATDKHYYV